MQKSIDVTSHFLEFNSKLNIIHLMRSMDGHVNAQDI